MAHIWPLPALVFYTHAPLSKPHCTSLRFSFSHQNTDSQKAVLRQQGLAHTVCSKSIHWVGENLGMSMGYMPGETNWAVHLPNLSGEFSRRQISQGVLVQLGKIRAGESFRKESMSTLSPEERTGAIRYRPECWEWARCTPDRGDTT